MKRPSSLFLACVSLAMFPMSSQALVLMLDFGATTAASPDWSTSPYHTANPSFTGTSWNKIQSADLASGSVLDSTGATATGIGIKVGEAAVSATTVVDLGLKTYSSGALGAAFSSGIYTGSAAGRDGIFASGGGNANKAVGVQISGLAAGIYEIYVSGRNTSTNVATDYTQNFSAGTAATGGTTFDFGGYTATGSVLFNGTSGSTSWVAGTNYVKLTVTVAAGDVLNIASIGGVAGPEKRGFLNSIEIVSIPEPSAIGLALLGALPAFRRRRSD